MILTGKRKKLFRKLGGALIFGLLVLPYLFSSPPTQAAVQPYYSGDAVYYQGQVIFGSTDTGYLEIFSLTGDEITPLLKMKNYDPLFKDYSEFHDLKLSVENNQLFIYAVSQYTLFKYDFSDLKNLSLVAKESNSYWEWYHRVDSFGDNLGTVSDEGVKIINPALQPIDAFAFTPDNKYSLRSSGSQEFLFGINETQIQVYDRFSRSVVQEIPLNFNSPTHDRKIYFDSLTNNIYAVDDYYAQKFSFDGQLLASFQHLDAPGYDVESSFANPYVYFSNGFGVVKMTKDDFKVVNYAYTTQLGGPGGWAMGLKLVMTPAGDVLVIFNASNIILLDKNLHKIASIRAQELALPQAPGALFLNLDHNIGAAGQTVNLTGGGYWPNESLHITFNGETVYARADASGDFNQLLTIPELSPQSLDIKVVGLDSGLSYSVAFTIQ